MPNQVPGKPGYLAFEAGSPDWQKQERHYRTYAHWGLALAALGTIMEAVPPVCTAIGSARRRRRIPPSDNPNLDTKNRLYRYFRDAVHPLPQQLPIAIRAIAKWYFVLLKNLALISALMYFCNHK
jgi:hypothetical protein